MDDSYAKRLWRISKNINLKYNKNYFKFCYGLKDNLLEYLNGKIKNERSQFEN
jgi:hypothetical protein